MFIHVFWKVKLRGHATAARGLVAHHLITPWASTGSELITPEDIKPLTSELGNGHAREFSARLK